MYQDIELLRLLCIWLVSQSQLIDFSPPLLVTGVILSAAIVINKALTFMKKRYHIERVYITLIQINVDTKQQSNEH